jgi:RNA polymerase sigma factor (sigma-70 family)
MLGDRSSQARWPEHLLALCRAVGPATCPGGAAPQDVRQARRIAAWIALRDALARFLRQQGPRFPAVSTEDQEDLASAKSLELLSRAESGEWRLEGRSGGELAGYLATVARNALIDQAKNAARFVPHAETDADVAGDDTGPQPAAAGPVVTPEAPVLAREFTEALRDCVARLQPRNRRVWFFRAFYEMSSREIAQHPAVAIRVAHVDVLVQRARVAIRSCLKSKGLEPIDMPTGAFVTVWAGLESLCDEFQATAETEEDS